MMRTIFLTRGAPGSGKSTWVSKNHLQLYTLEADAFRLLLSGPVLDTEGKPQISQKQNREAWDALYRCLEKRMRRGEFIVVDATHYKRTMLSAYKGLVEKYMYRAYVVDFTGVPMETALERNSRRPAVKQVPEEAIRKMYAVFDGEEKEVPGFMKVLTPDEAAAMVHDPLLYSYDCDKVVIFGDIHGCMEPLRAYFSAHPFSEKTRYIFVGDYIDRGIQNREVVEFLLTLMDKTNVLMLEGNHERWLRMWAADKRKAAIPEDEKKVLRKYVGKEFFADYEAGSIRSEEFLQHTAKELQGISKKEVRKLCRKLAQMAYFRFQGKNYFVTHGGVPCPPSLLIPTEQYIKGVGKYEEVDKIYDTWLKHTADDVVLVHGHRNVFSLPARVHDRVYNLCSAVEEGEPLRVLEISEEGERVLEIPNPVYDTTRQHKDAVVSVLPVRSDNDIIQELNTSPLVAKKILKDGIVSYNFSRDVFFDRKWNDLTEKARGLFIDSRTGRVVARSYDKFFNWGEMPELTGTEALQKRLVFPVTAYKKENGFLALISWDVKHQDFFIASKSTNGGDYADRIRRNFVALVSEEDRAALKDYLKDGRHTLLFECVDPDEDPHIIPYRHHHLYLLDIMDNDLTTHKLPYADMVRLADRFHLEHKTLFHVFRDFQELYRFVDRENHTMDTRYEGWVFEDSAGFMVKYKTRFYRFWKQMRSIKEKISLHRPLKEKYITEEEIKVTQLLKSIEKETPGRLDTLSMYDVEGIYYRTVDG